MSLRELEEQADAGSVVAQSVLGCALVWGGELEGETLKPDYLRALLYLQKAAEAGASRAIHHLGVLYEDGLGVAEDHSRAASLHEQAAEAGEYFAVLHLARMCADGRLGAGQAQRARVWYGRLLEMGGNVESSADAEPEMAEAKLYLTTGALDPNAKRERGCL